MKKNYFVLIGLALALLGFRTVLLPLNVNIGGFAGISQILNYFFNVPFSASSILLNGALFLWAWKNEGGKSVIRAVFTTVAFSVLLDWLPVIALPDISLIKEWMLIVVASVCVGCGFGLILRGEATTGGSDYLGKLIVRYIPISMGAACTIINLSIVAATALLFGISDLVQAICATVIVNESVNITLYVKSDRPLPASLRYLGKALHKCRAYPPKRSSKNDTNDFSIKGLQQGKVYTLHSGGSTIKLQIISVTHD